MMRTSRRTGRCRPPALEEIGMQTRSQRVLLLLAAVVLTAGCASTNQPTTWRDPAYTGPGFRKVFVVGLNSRSLVDQRGFEDLMVSTLQGAGVAAVPGWQYVPTDRTPDQATMRAAVAQSGADAVLLARMSGFTTQSEFLDLGDPMYAPGDGLYAGFYQPTVVAQYQVATIYTTLFDARTASQIWTFNAPTFDPTTLQQDAPRYASDVAGLLRSNGLLAAR
jgi:hypothetical protein